MAKVYGPLMSVRASGTIGRSLTFMNINGTNVVRQWSYTKQENTRKKLIQQNYIRQATYTWHQITNSTRTQWNNWTKENEPTISGFDKFVSVYVKTWIDTFTQPTIFNNPPHMS